MWKEAPPPSPAKSGLGNTATQSLPGATKPGGPYEGGNLSQRDVGTSQGLSEDGRPSPASGMKIKHSSDFGTGNI